MEQFESKIQLVSAREQKCLGEQFTNKSSNVVKINNVILTPIKKDLYLPILTNLYNTLNLSKIKYQNISNKSHLLELKAVEHYVTYHMHGFNYILFLTTVNNKCYNCFISKKELKYYLNQNNMDELKIYLFNMKFIKQHYYNDTILDGKIIKSDGLNASFMIYDCYTLCGSDMYNIEMDKKFSILNQLINEFNVNITQENMVIKLMPLYNYNDIPQIIESPPLKINGLVFLPKLSGKFYIFTSETEFNKVKTENVIKPQIQGSTFEFIMKKTDIPDVYELYVENTEGIYKEGIAHIPNIFTSEYCVNLFKNQTTTKMKCIKSMKFNKWVPLVQDITELSTVLF
jgi:hypothetical protein